MGVSAPEKLNSQSPPTFGSAKNRVPMLLMAFESSPRARRRKPSEDTMNKRTEKREMKDELRREYDLTKLKGGVRGKYVTRYRNGTNLVLLSPEIAKYFPDEQSVNTALRSLIRVAKGSTRRGAR
jgi:hypothetical protein